MRGTFPPILTLLAFVTATGCQSPDSPAAGADAANDPTTSGSQASGDAPESPASPATASPDSVVAWAVEIRAGIATLPRQVADEPDEARQRAVELYVTRQERIEQASGPGTGSAADLAESIHQAEARFHELMQLLGGTPPPDSTAVRLAVESLDSRLADVVDLAGGESAVGSR